MMERSLEPDTGKLVEVSKPLFYGFTFLTGVTMAESPDFTGTLLGMAVLSAITFISAGLAGSLEDDWQKFLEIISVASLLLVTLFAAYMAAVLSFV